MTDTDTFTPSAPSLRRAHSNTIYRDTPQPHPTPSLTRALRPRLRALTQPGDLVSDGILLGLAALMLPVLVYTFAQMGSLASSGSLEHAIRAFLP